MLKKNILKLILKRNQLGQSFRKDNFQLLKSISQDEIKKQIQNLNLNIQNKFNRAHDLYQQNPNNKKYLLAFLGSVSIGYFIKQQLEEEFITYQEFMDNHIQSNNVLSIHIRASQKKGTYAYAKLVNGSPICVRLGSVDHFLSRLEKAQLEKGRASQNFIPVSFEKPMDSERVYWFLKEWSHIIFSFALFVLTIRSIKQQGSGMMKENKGFRIFGLDEKIKTKFKDVAGLEEVKIEISEFVDFLQHPEKYQQMGARLPKGALLTGPPGCGKTLLAKACAGEAGVPFITMSGSDFVEMFVGVGASRVRNLFKQAKKNAPCIIFIDEIDAIGKKRDSGGGNDEKDNTLNQILVEMDGFGTDSQVIVMAATNRKDLLDQALIRPGRFDRQIEVQLPDIGGRVEIFKIHLKPLTLDPSISTDEYAKRLASLSPGFSGADISNLCNEAAILASRKDKKFVEQIDFEMASEKVIAGLEKKSTFTKEERRTVAVHESGHAVISWFTEGCDPLVKITIIPRSKGSLGFAQYLPDETFIKNKQQLLDQLCFILGGRAAEKVFFNKITTGASDDIQKVYSLATSIVTKFGMSELGNQAFQEEQFELKHSQETQKEIDIQIQKIVKEATERSINLIEKYREYVEKLSEQLLEKESLNLKQIIEVLGERPGKKQEAFQAYLDQKS